MNIINYLKIIVIVKNMILILYNIKLRIFMRTMVLGGLFLFINHFFREPNNISIILMNNNYGNALSSLDYNIKYLQ